MHCTESTKKINPKFFAPNKSCFSKWCHRKAHPGSLLNWVRIKLNAVSLSCNTSNIRIFPTDPSHLNNVSKQPSRKIEISHSMIQITWNSLPSVVGCCKKLWFKFSRSHWVISLGVKNSLGEQCNGSQIAMSAIYPHCKYF